MGLLNHLRSTLFIACPLAALGGIGDPARAADAAAQAPESLSEVVVTARKRSERLLDVPIAISAVTAEGIEKQGIASLFDLTRSTPSLSVTNTVTGSARTDRSFPTYVIRGMTPSSTNTPTTRVFVDGAPFATAQIGGLDDLARVEVLYGPQSAYFGRQTFAGAINLVTKDPGTEFGGALSALAGTDDYYDVRGSLEGPILGEKLMARASVRYFTRDGSYDNKAAAGFGSGTIGDQSTTSGTLTLLSQLTDNLRIRAMYMAWEDDDGPGPTAFVGPSQANCTTAAGPWFCGEAPQRRENVQPAVNNVIDTPVQNWLNLISAPGALLYAPPSEYGLEREADHWHLGIDYEFGSSGTTLTSLTAGSHDEFNTLIDLDVQDSSGVPNPFRAAAGIYGRAYYDSPFLVQQRDEDFSQELRLTSSEEGRFRWLVGANYTETSRDSAIAGLLVGGVARILTKTVPAYESESLGGFFGLAYDFTDRITANFEGRYQQDTGRSPLQNVEESYNNFTPRVIVEYEFTPDVMTYLTYAEGVNHSGTFNSSVLQVPPETAQALLDAFGAKVAVDPEKVTNYELGLKGRFFDGALTFTGAIYHMIWEDQILSNQVIVFPMGVQTLVSVTYNGGESEIDGFELAATWVPVDGLDITLSGSLNDAEIKTGGCAQCVQITGIRDPVTGLMPVAGKVLPNTSRVQANLAVGYNAALGSLPDWNWFGRIDYSYKEGTYATADNLLKSPDLGFLNLRVGVSRDDLRIEAFAENLTDEDGYTALTPYGDNANPFRNPARQTDSFLGGLPWLRTYGVRFRYSFGGLN